MVPASDVPSLRRCILAASVLDNIDLVPHADGVLLPDQQGQLVPWTDIADVVGAHDPASVLARRRVTTFLRLRALVIELGSEAAWRLRAAARLVALPRDHAAHGGPEWVQERLPGKALDLGLGAVGLFGDPDGIHVLPPQVLRACGVHGEDWWQDVHGHAERMGGLAATRISREDYPGNTHSRRAVVRPVGGCDVLALLASSALRRQLATGDGSGMRALAVPMRTRGWFELSRIDPAFTLTAWSATDDFDRGVPCPLLVTADEVSLPADGGNPVGGSLDLDRDVPLRSRDGQPRRGFSSRRRRQ